MKLVKYWYIVHLRYRGTRQNIVCTKIKTKTKICWILTEWLKCDVITWYTYINYWQSYLMDCSEPFKNTEAYINYFNCRVLKYQEFLICGSLDLFSLQPHLCLSLKYNFEAASNLFSENYNSKKKTWQNLYDDIWTQM